MSDLVWKVAACALGRSFPLAAVECECLKQATLFISMTAQWRERPTTQSSITAAGVLLAPTPCF